METPHYNIGNVGYYSSLAVGGGVVTSSVTDMRLKAWMAASCTESVVAGCLMHLTRVVFISACAASIASPMLPITWMEEKMEMRKNMELEVTVKSYVHEGPSQPVTYPQGQEGQLLLSGAVPAQEGRHEVRHIIDLRGDTLNLVQSVDKCRH